MQSCFMKSVERQGAVSSSMQHHIDRYGARAAGLAAAIGCIAWSSIALGQGATVSGTFGAWNLYTTDSGNTRICFIAAAPEEKKPATANRATMLFYISAWPKDGVRSEISVKLGYPIKKDSAVDVAVGTDTFKLFPKDERAYVADATDELKLLESMKKGVTATVQATSERGTTTTDTYSLIGISQALQSMAQACP